jgi:hypothetical protein
MLAGPCKQDNGPSMKGQNGLTSYANLSFSKRKNSATVAAGFFVLAEMRLFLYWPFPRPVLSGR